MLARTESLAIALAGVVAYSAGLEFALEVRLRRYDETIDPFDMRFGGRGRTQEGLPPELLRFGFELADGRRATNVGGFPDWQETPTGPVLVQRGGGGGGHSWSLGFWLWPLPPPGTLGIAVEWPKQGIPLVRHEVDTGTLLEAAGQSEVLWPDGGGRVGGGSSVSQLMSSARPPETPSGGR